MPIIMVESRKKLPWIMMAAACAKYQQLFKESGNGILTEERELPTDEAIQA
ncbi:10457_t:CDS:2 [Racocetra persica]|uniref:10457_t:CDS:1 n=1 Tax=Racocetra persica TaxID=160502 RepID=A0ACA9NTY4_9GLOM|nr:10457_t:CDS:2 [Racocetra persica]